MRAIFLGAHHPHIFHRVELLKKRSDVELVGYWEQDEKIATKVEEQLVIPRFITIDSLLTKQFDIVFVHALDPEVPRLARMATDKGAKGILLEKPGAARPEDFYKLAEYLEGKNIVVEIGWEMHYAEVMDFARRLVRNNILGDITTSRFHGGCPSGAGAELWQRLDSNLGGLVFEEGSHTLENIIDLFGQPKQVSASIRKLPLGKIHPIVSCFYDMEKQRLDPETTLMAVGDIRHEDIGSVILEYDYQNVVADFTAWEPTYWCEDWSIDIYGTNGVFHGVVNPPRGSLYLREARGGFPVGKSEMDTVEPNGVRNEEAYYKKQVELFLARSMTRIETEKCDVTSQMILMKVLDAIYRAADQRKFVPVE